MKHLPTNQIVACCKINSGQQKILKARKPLSFVKSLATGMLLMLFFMANAGLLIAQTTFNADTYAELTAAITSSVDNDIINITNDIVVTAQVAINKSLTINGNGNTISVPVPGINDDGTFATSPSAFRVFSISGTAKSINLNDLILKGGSITIIQGGGCIYIAGSNTVRITNSTISNSRTNRGGGGIANSFGNTIYLNNVKLINNAASFGGGIQNQGIAYIENTSMVKNRSTSGAGGGGGMENSGTLYMNNSTFSNNQSTEIGGGINNIGGTAWIMNSTFTGNIGYGYLVAGGAIGINNGTVTLINNIFAYNYVRNEGTLTDPTSFMLSDVDKYTGFGAINTLNAYYNITQSALPTPLADVSNIIYTGAANGSDNSLFLEGILATITDASGLPIGTGMVFRPTLLYEDNHFYAPLQPLGFAARKVNRGTKTGYTNGSGSPVIGYFNGTAWVDLLRTNAQSHEITIDQKGNPRLNLPVRGAIEVDMLIELTITGVTANNKVYDGTTTATLNGGTLFGVEGSDVVSFTAGTGTFATANVGAGIIVTASGYVLTGADAGKYILTQPTGLTADIMEKPITIAGVTANNKVYDGNTTATLSGGTLNGIETADVVSFTAGTGTFATATAGTAIVVTATGYTLTGADAANYSVSQPTGLTADITAKPITIAGVTANHKVYDGNTTATLSGGTLNGIETADVVSFTAGTGTFATATVGTAIVVTASGYALAGADAANYSVSQPSGLIADITAKPITIAGVTANNKVYDGNTTATLTGGTLTGVVTDDVVSITAGTGTFATANVGTAIEVTASGYALAGADAANYSVSQPTGLSADISAKPITIAGVTASNKVYDANTTAALAGGTLTGVVTDDVVSFTTGTGTFATATVGTAIVVTASGYALAGADAANYSVSQPSGLTADITAKPITIIGITANNKVYDGNTTAIITEGNLSGVETGDVVTITAGTGTFATANVGTAIVVTAVGYALTGADAANYSVSQPAGLSANITVKELTINNTIVETTKEYDGTTTAAVIVNGTISGVAAIDESSLGFTVEANYSDALPGVDKTITVVYTLTGTPTANYVVFGYQITTGVIEGTITPRASYSAIPGCAGNETILNYTIIEGVPIEYRIVFGQAAKNQGFIDIEYTALPSAASSGIIAYPIPENATYGSYEAQIQMRDEVGNANELESFNFTINLSADYIVNKFDDVVLFDNSSNEFVSYQWYKDGVKIEGATNQFYNDLNGLSGTYSISVVTTGGLTFHSCEKYLEKSFANAAALRVFPNPVSISEIFIVQIDNLAYEELQGAVMRIYNNSGIMVYATEQVELQNSISLPFNGVYHGILITRDGIKLTYKVIVGK